MTLTAQARNTLHMTGLVTAPALWVLSTQGALLLPHADCRLRLTLSLLASALAALLSLASAGISLAAIGRTRPRMRVFLGLISALAALIFTYALLLQMAASFLVDRCQS
jgi:hypothetical protein